MKKMYNIQEMIDLPMKEVLADYGIQVNARGMFKLRDERTASAKYYEKTNTFYDFGGGIGGNNINLIQALRQCSKDTAKEILGEDFGLSLYGGDVENLSNSQYERIGLYGGKASMNWDFDLDRPMEEVWALSTRLGSMTMNQLRKDQPERYATIIRARAIPFMGEQRDLYLDGLRQTLIEQDPIMLQVRGNQAEEAYGDYSTAYGVLVRSVKGINIDVRHLRPDYGQDLARLKAEQQQTYEEEQPFSEYSVIDIE